MKTTRWLAAGACALALVAGATRAEEVPAEKRAEVERLLEVTGALAMGQQMANFFITSMTQSIRRQNPGISQEVIDALPEEVNAVMRQNLPAFKELVIPLYAKYFSVEELRGLNAFYASELGRKTISVMPALLQESMTIGASWGQAMQPQIVQRMRARFKKENLRI